MAALAFAMVFPTLAIWMYFYAAGDPAVSRFAYGAAKAVQFAFPLGWVLLAERGRLGTGGGDGRGEARRAEHAMRPAGPGLGVGLATGLAALAGIAVGYPVLLAGWTGLAGAPAGIGEKLALFGVSTPARFVLFAAFYSLIHSFLEEYYWRWFVFGRLRRYRSPRAAGIVSSLAFTSHHVLLLGVLLGGFGAATWLLALGVAAAGGAWAWLYHRSGSLAAPWISHALADAGLMWVGYQLWKAGGGV
jgi:uncharacterized protein